jgi:cysteine desulfurase
MSSFWSFFSLEKPPQVYLDHNATTPLAPAVRQEMERISAEFFGNASSLHTLGRASRGLIDTARRRVAEVLHCHPDRLIFTSGGTEGNNAVLKGVFLTNGGKGHIITTKIEHESVLGACRQIELLGGKVTCLPADRRGRVSLAAVEAAITPETILISVMHANNETGVIQPIRELSAIARQHNVLLHTDAVQTFGKIPVQPDELGCDFLTLTAHKINGPKGCGAVYQREGRSFMPLIYGGDQEGSLRAGTEGVHQIAGLGKAAELAGARGEPELVRLKNLRRRLKHGIRRVFPEARFNEAPAEFQLPGTLNVTFPGKSGLRLLAGLDCYGIGVSIGSACTADRIEPSHVLLGMGISEADALSSIRVSMGPSTGTFDVLYFLWVLKRILAGDPAGFSYLDPKHLTEERITSPDTFLIDLRLPHERLMASSLPQARNWTHIGFERYLAEIPADKEVILMCATGVFSLGAGYQLAHHGHKKVRVVFGGYVAWKALNPDLFARLIGS